MTLWKVKYNNNKVGIVRDINALKQDSYLSAEKLEPSYVCSECGGRYGRKPKGVLVTTMHLDKCDICGKTRGLCHIRNYNYLRK